jgi:hypothetical protein
MTQHSYDVVEVVAMQLIGSNETVVPLSLDPPIESGCCVRRETRMPF